MDNARMTTYRGKEKRRERDSRVRGRGGSVRDGDWTERKKRAERQGAEGRKRERDTEGERHRERWGRVNQSGSRREGVGGRWRTVQFGEKGRGKGQGLCPGEK